MSGPEHYREAEQILTKAWVKGDFGPDTAVALAAAQVHATLALAAAQAESIANTGTGVIPPVRGRSPWTEAIS